MKKKLKFLGKKILISILIVLTLNNFILGTAGTGSVYATTTSTSFGEDSIYEGAIKTAEDILTAVVGILTLPARLLFAGFFLALDALVTRVAYIDGATEKNKEAPFLTPYEILFNKIQLTDINFFDIKSVSTGDSETMVNKVRKQVAQWYYIMRNISAAVLLVILIYVGIRMSISTIASEQAKYKKMFVDWVVSLALVFLMQYIILFTIYVNDAFVGALAPSNFGKLENVYKDIAALAVKWNAGVEGLAALLIFILLIWQTFGLLISYFNRMIKCAFLIIISPLVTLTYSIDKMADAKAQALSTWLKEYIFSILIQPFHCVIYMALVQTSFEILASSNSNNQLANAFLAILCVNFIKKSEEIVRKIFAFADDNRSTGLVAGTAIVASSMQNAQNIGSTARNTINNFQNWRASIGDNMHNARINAMAGASALASSFGSSDSDDTLAERYENAKTEIENRYAEREEERAGEEARQRYSVQQNEDGTYTAMSRDKDGNLVKDEEFQKAIQAKMNANPEMSFARAAARVRAERAKEARKKKREERFPKTSRAVHFISSAKGTVGKIARTASNSAIANMYKQGLAATLFATAEYAHSGRLSTAYMAGQAGARGAKEFFSTSTATLADDAYTSLKVLGVGDKYQAADTLRSILMQAEKYSDNSDEMKAILDKIKKELKSLGLDDRAVDNIRYAIQKNVKEGNPIEAIDVASRVLASEGISREMLESGSAASLGDEISRLSSFENRRNIASQWQKADAVGVSQERFISAIVAQMPSGVASSSRTTRREETTTHSYTDVTTEDIVDTGSTERERIIQTIESARERELSDDDIDGLDIDARQQAYDKMMQQLESNMRSQDENLAYGGRDAGLDLENRILRENIERMAERILHIESKEIITQMEVRISEDAKRKLSDAIHDVDELKRLFDMRIKELDEVHRRLEEEGKAIAEQAKLPGADKDEIETQKRNLLNKLSAVESRRNSLKTNFSDVIGRIEASETQDQG